MRTKACFFQTFHLHINSKHCASVCLSLLPSGICPASLVCMLNCFSHVPLFATLTHQAPLSMGFSRQGYWSGLPFPPPGDLPNPGIKPRYRALQADSLPSEPPEKSGFKHKPSLQTPVPCLLLLTSSKFRMFQDLNLQTGGFPGGSVVRNRPANAGDTGWMLCLGRSHVPRISQAFVPQPLSLCLEPGSHNY